MIVAVGASQLGVAPYRHEPAKKHRQSKLDETDTCGESDAVTGSTAAHRDRPQVGRDGLGDLHRV